MSIQFSTQTTTDILGGNGGVSFQDIPGPPQALVGLDFDSKSFTNDVEVRWDNWTIHYKMIRALVPYWAAMNVDGTVGPPVRGTQIGNAPGGFTTAGPPIPAPEGYVVTGIFLRWESLQDGPTLIKAFMLIWAKWEGGKVDSTTTTTDGWHGGDGQIPCWEPPSMDPLSWESNAAGMDGSKTGEHGSVMGPNGSCVVGLVGRSGDEVDALGIVHAVPQIITA